MRKAALYSRSTKPSPQAGADAPAAATPAASGRSWRHALRERRLSLLPVMAGGLCALAAVILYAAFVPKPRVITQEDIDAAVLHTFETVALPSRAAKAFEAVRESVVRVRGLGHEQEKDGHIVEGIGSGVVIVDTGIILTNLHVVAGAERVEVRFHDGFESEAIVIGVRPEHDLAVLKAVKIPDDLPAATLRSTADLVPGDEVVAVGYPFGIGPSVSSGVISGLAREYRSPKGERVLTNLIQFDAAANPGNSGGPLVTMDGEVVGIVTAILNPTDQRVFIGVGFAVPIENAAAAIGVSPF
ncbi:MAG: trypsin-like peptidase domain-containing protein [Casimicrobiaceae bacterium]